MAIFRVYSSKNNTIASGSDYQLLNSSQSPICDIWYGGNVLDNGANRNSISRHLLYFDLTELQSKLSAYTINSNYISSYRLKIKNCIPNDNLLLPEFEFNVLNKQIAQSFDLIAFPVNKFWDEGRGYDLTEMHYIKRARGDIKMNGVSNWLSATTLTAWTESGVFANPSASTTNYATQHFSTGAEDLDMDITNMVRNWLSGGSTNYGLCIAYTRPYELLSTDTRYIASFFTNKTNTAYKPFIEARYNQVIQDDRLQVSNNRVCKLFLYTYSGNTPVNYYSAGTVTIRNASTNAIIQSGITPTIHSKGVYFVSVFMSGGTKGQKYKDEWNNVTFAPGYDAQTFTQSFEIRDNYYTSNATDFNEYIITTYGLANNQVIQSGEQIRIYIEARKNYSTNRPYVDYGLEYRLTMNNVNELISWTKANTAVINNGITCFVDLDTSWLINEQNYQIQFRINELGSIKILPDLVYFKVVESFYPVNGS